MADHFQSLRELLLAGEADVPELLKALAEAIASIFGSDADGILVSFGANDQEAIVGDVGELARLAATECSNTNGNLIVYPPTEKADLRCVVLHGKVGKKDPLSVAVVGNRFLSLRKLRSAQKLSVYLGYTQAACVVRARRGSVPRNWWESLGAAISFCKEEGSVLFFAPADQRRFPNIWAFEARVRTWLTNEILPRMPGARVLYLTNGIFAVISKGNAGTVWEAVNSRYRDASFRDGRFDLRAALLPIPPYFTESIDACTLLCEDAAKLLKECNGDEIVVTLRRGKEDEG